MGDDIFVLKHEVALVHGHRHLAADPSPKLLAYKAVVVFSVQRYVFDLEPEHRDCLYLSRERFGVPRLLDSVVGPS